MSQGNLTPDYKPSIFRQDFPQVLACNRQFATLLPIMVAYREEGYRWGQVMARYTSGASEGLYGAYDDTGASGLEVAACLILESIDMSASTGTQAAVGVFGGEVYEDQCTGLDANAKTDLNGRSITDATGVTIFKF